MATNVLAGITYVHTIRYMQKGIDTRGPFYAVEYYIEDYDDSDAFINALMGTSSYGGVTTSYTGPHRHPLSPNLICTSAVLVDGLGEPTLDPTNGYPDFAGGALIRAEYRAPVVGGSGGGGGIIAVGDDPLNLHQIDPFNPILWCTQELDFATETITRPDASYKWVAPGSPFDGKTVDSPVQIDIPITTMVLTFHALPYLPIRLIREARGRINSDPFLGAPAECVRFVGARTIREWSTSGKVQQKVTMTFMERPYSWNRLLLPNRMPGSTNAFREIEDADGNVRFLDYDLRKLVKL